MSTKASNNKAQNSFESDNMPNDGQYAGFVGGEHLEASYQVRPGYLLRNLKHTCNSILIQCSDFRMKNWASMAANIISEKSNYKQIAAESGIHVDFAMTR
jgi:hypothetical protein